MAGGQRLMRLIGDGAGGLPLPLAFGAVAENILDNGSVRFGELVKLLSQRLAFKEDYILSTAWRSWECFGSDILDQMSGVDDDARRILMDINGEYYLSPDFKPGQFYSVIPGTDIGFTSNTREVRERLDRVAQYQMIVRSVLSEHARFTKIIEDDTRILDDDKDDANLRRYLECSTSFVRSGVKLLAGEKTDEPKPKVRTTEGTIKTIRGSKLSGVPGQLGWSRDWLRDHPGEWMSMSALRNLYVAEFNITGEVSPGSIGNGFKKEADDPQSPIQCKRVMRGNRPFVQYAWVPPIRLAM